MAFHAGKVTPIRRVKSIFCCFFKTTNVEEKKLVQLMPGVGDQISVSSFLSSRFQAYRWRKMPQIKNFLGLCWSVWT